MFGRARTLLALSTVGLLLGVWPLGVQAQSVSDLRSELTDIEGQLAGLRREPLRRDRQRSATYVEERLTDGELYYRLQDYSTAVIVFTDIVENYGTHRAAPDARFLLGESLFQAGDNLGARARFREIIDRADQPGYGPYIQRALGRLIEIAIRIRDFEGVDQYFQRLSQLPPTEVEAVTAYFRAKYLYNRAVPVDEMLGEGNQEQATIDFEMIEEARVAFEAVPDGSPYWPQARYFIGVIHTLRSELPQAIEAFRRVLRGEASSTEHREVVEMTQLALGRLYYETNQLDQAVEAYQAVPRTSSHFDSALYEVAWVYIRMGDATRAERALEVLSVAVPDSHFIPDGKILRGNLLLRNGRFDDAEQVFDEVREEFGPVYRELDEVRASHENLGEYFRTLVRDNMEDFDIDHFLPESARRYVDLEGDFDRATRVLSDLSLTRRLVRETSDLLERLRGRVEAPNAVGAFPVLRSQRERTTLMRNRLSRVRRGLASIDERRSGNATGELAEIRERRRRIERDLGRMPTDEDDFAVRDDRLLSRYRGLQRELSNMEVELVGMEARIVATRRFLQQTAEEHSNPEAVLAELANQERGVDNFREQIEELRRLVDIARSQVGVGDTRYQRDEELRDEYRRLVDRERELGGGNSETEPLHRQANAIESELDAQDAAIDTAVNERLVEVRQILQEEGDNLVTYRATLAELEGETEEVVGAVTRETFGVVRDRFYDLVLRADVGRIDISWQRREEHRMRVDMLTRERQRELRALDDEFRDIMDEGSSNGGNQ